MPRSRKLPTALLFPLALSISSRLVAQTAPPAPSPVNTPALYPSGAGTPLGDRVAALLADPRVAGAHWGIAVTALEGTPLYGLDEGKLFRPASTTKLFTTAAAMALLGPEKTWATTVRGDLNEVSGTVKGDLVLVGAGDPGFGTDDIPYMSPAQRAKAAPKPIATPPSLRDLEQLADQVVAKGVKQVTGSVVGDDTLFVHEPYGEGWSQDDAVWGYGAPVSALSIADNEMLLTVAPGRNAGTAEQPNYRSPMVTLEQYGVPYYNLSRPVDTSPPHGPASTIQVDRAAGTRNLRVYGFVREGSAADLEHVAIDDPAAFSAVALRQFLLARGVAVSGGARAQHIEPYDARGILSLPRELDGCDRTLLQGGHCSAECMTSEPPGKILATHVSPPLSADVVLTAKVSQNLHAEVLFHQLGLVDRCGQSSTLKASRVLRAFAMQAGISANDFLFYDGSGLSAKDIVTPRAETQLLAYAVQQPWFAQWKAALPVGGVDGSLSGRFKEAKDTPPEVARLKGHVFAKTGTLGESRALAGYLDCASGKTVIFSVMVDNHLPGTSADREVMDRIVSAIAETQ